MLLRVAINVRDIHLHKLMMSKFVYPFLCLVFFSANLKAELPVQLVSVYQSNIDVSDYLISEKFDGVRAIWKDGKLLTKNGNPIHAPDWFIQALPDVWLDGELWSKRQDFEFVASTVLSKKSDTQAWRKVQYKVFDMPNYQSPFVDRAKAYTELLNALNVDFIQPIEQFTLRDNDALSEMLKRYSNAGAEGLILHRKEAKFASGRSDNLLKLKPYQEAKAKVKAYLPGKGKYLGMIGAIEVAWYSVELEQEVRFKIGSGLTDDERRYPPEIGSLIRFKYHGLTKNKIPRFASYIGLVRPQ
ncbi:DNA ligase [Marinomonas sp. MED121]|uniref:DNA ligase n=1 Tax=Marinomonas sp. MED121 TaxID=314277 RepID=UPI000068FD51|nr:DNA ligase [Marinomonas sp. MED121]EAQ63683.1 DNA ligase [Marinomonas sp. MED121]